MRTTLAVLLVSMFAAVPASAQQASAGPAPLVVGQQQAASTLITGTAVPLRVVSTLTTKGKKLKVGERFSLEVAEPVALNGITVIPTGSMAVAEITTIRNKGMFGKSGLIEARLLHVKVGNRNIRLTGRMDDKGSKNGVGAGVATYATLVGGFLITGTSAVIPAGTIVTGYLDEDVPIAFASGAPTSNPLVVPVN